MGRGDSSVSTEPTTKAEAIEIEKQEAEKQRASLEQRIEHLQEYIDWLDTGIDIAEKIPTGVPALSAGDGAAAKPPPRKKPGPKKGAPRRKPAVETNGHAERADVQAVHARCDRLFE